MNIILFFVYFINILSFIGTLSILVYLFYDKFCIKLNQFYEKINQYRKKINGVVEYFCPEKKLNYHLDRYSGVDEVKKSEFKVPFTTTNSKYLLMDRLNIEGECYTLKEEKKIVDSFSFLVGLEFSKAKIIAEKHEYSLIEYCYLNKHNFKRCKGNVIPVELERKKDKIIIKKLLYNIGVYKKIKTNQAIFQPTFVKTMDDSFDCYYHLNSQ